MCVKIQDKTKSPLLSVSRLDLSRKKLHFLMSDLKVNVNGDPKGLIEVSLFNVVASLILSRPEMLKRCQGCKTMPTSGSYK